MKKRIIVMLAMAMILGTLMAGCSIFSNNDSAISADKVLVRAASRRVCIRHPEVIPRFTEICTEGSGKPSDLLAIFIKEQIDKYSLNIIEVKGLDEDVNDLLDLMKIPLQSGTIEGLDKIADDERLAALFSSACEGVVQAQTIVSK